MLSRRRLLLSGLALGLSGRAALAQSHGNEADPFAGMDAGVDAGGELFDPALLPPPESPIDFPITEIPERRIKKKFRRQMVEAVQSFMRGEPPIGVGPLRIPSEMCSYQAIVPKEVDWRDYTATPV